MNNRHGNTGKTLGGRRYDTTHFQAPPPSNNDIWIIAKKYDRMDLLAHRYYGDRNLWWIIASCNELVNGSLVIPTGKRIRIPSDSVEFMKSIDKSTWDIDKGRAQGLPDGLGGGAY